MPHTYRALQAGVISEWRATLMVRETACLSVDDRGRVDAELAPRLSSLGDKRTAQAAAMIAQRLDAANCVKRHRKAVGDRRVSIRPAPDTMAYLTALLPVAQGVAVYAALTRHANSSTAIGDTRGRGQIMADEIVRRVIGASTTDSEVSKPAPGGTGTTGTTCVGTPRPATAVSHDLTGVHTPGWTGPACNDGTGETSTPASDADTGAEMQPADDDVGDAGTVPAGATSTFTW
jgi:hypothetical protein